MADLDEMLASRKVALRETIDEAEGLIDRVGDISKAVADSGDNATRSEVARGVAENAAGQAAGAVALEANARVALIDSDPDGRTLLGQAVVGLFRDAAGNILAGFRQADGTFLAKLPISVGTSNGLSFAAQPDGSYRLALGTTEGALPIGGMVLDGAFDDDNSLYVLRDAARNVIARVRRIDGAFLAKLGVAVGTSNGLSFQQQIDGTYVLSLGATEGVLPIGGMTFDGVADSDEDLLVWRDAAKNIILRVKRADGALVGNFASPELIAARGSKLSVGARLDTALTAAGRPRGQFYQLETLVETHRRLRTLSRGGAAQWVGAFIGDSWTHGVNYWMRNLALQLRAKYGNAGPGWLGLGYPGSVGTNQMNGNVDPFLASTSASLVYNGAFRPTYNAASSPDISSLTADAGASVTITYGNPAAPAASQTLSKVELFFQAGAGAIEYRWNGAGDFVPLAMPAGPGLGIVALAGVPANGWTLEIRWAATTTLYGLDLQATTSGVRVHKLGGTGSRAQQWAAADEMQWKAGLAELAPHYVQIMLAGNDQVLYDAATFRGYVQTMIDRVRAAVPRADLMLGMQPVLGIARPYPMQSFTEVMGDLAAANGCAFFDLQPSFGPPDYALYGDTSQRAFILPDKLHPTTDGGDAVLDAITTALRA